MLVGVYKHKKDWHHSEETKQKIRLANTDKTHSEETKKKQSEIKKKNPTNYWLGKKRPSPSDETKKKMSNSQKRIGNKPPTRIGKANNKWKGGISRAYKTGYGSTKYKIWRKSVFERDSYTCQVCEEVGGCLNAHHIKSFANYPKLRFDVNNGVTLCKECHKLKHKSKNKRK